MKKKLAFVTLLLCVLLNAAAQDKTLYQKHWFIQSGDSLPYRILFPVNYNANTAYPVIFFLHGRGESGRDNEKQLTHGAQLFLKEDLRQAFPAIVIFPQCGATDYWSNVHTIAEGAQNGPRNFYFVPGGPPSQSMQLLLGLVEHVQARYKIKGDQQYVMGLSMGGMGTFELVRRMPNTFAAAIPICGGAHTSTAKALKKTAWWVFHGGKDDVVPPVHSQKMVDALRAQKASIKFTLYPAANHNSWDSAFAEKDLLPWLFSQKRK